MLVKQEHHTDQYSIYNSDNMEVMPSIPDNSVDLAIHSPPFCGLYQYSSDPRDMSNCETREQFLQSYEFLIKEMARTLKPGRVTAVHCTDVFDNSCRLWDFPHEIIRLHEKHGFQYRNRITIWKEPLKVRMRTMVKSLMHKLIVEDSTQCFTAMPDYVLVLTKKGDNAVPVTHPVGFETLLRCYALSFPTSCARSTTPTKHSSPRMNCGTTCATPYADHKDPKSNKLSHYIWQRYASSVWDDIRIDNVLPFRDSKEEDDEKHVHPLQLDVIDRLVELYSNPGEVVLTPFMGVGSEVYSPVSLGRKAIGIELKDSYFKQAKINLQLAANREFEDRSNEQQTFLDILEPEVA